MSFRTDGLAKAYNRAQNEALRVKSFATSANNALAAGAVSANAVIQIMSSMKSSIEVWDTVSALPGLVQYARDQEDDQTYDVVAEFLAMKAAAEAVRDWVINNFPTAAGFIQKDTLELDGAITVRQFTPAQTAGLQTTLATLAAAVA